MDDFCSVPDTKKPLLCLELNNIDTFIKEDDFDYEQFVCLGHDIADDSFEIS